MDGRILSSNVNNMNLLIIEDDRNKADTIAALASAISNGIRIKVSSSLADAVRTMEQISFDLIVLDFMLPLNESGPAIDCGEELLQIVNASSRNRAAGLVAVTAYSELVETLSQKFAEAGVIVCEYAKHTDAWQTTLTSLIRKYAAKASRRFVIICALDKERRAFSKTTAVLEKAESIQGLDICNITVDGILGVVIVCPRMGLVNSSVISSLAIERFSPEILCMSGICAGISGESEIGQILIAHPCFEYQVGKYAPTGFEIEQYQISLSEELRQSLKIIASCDSLMESMYESFTDDFIPHSRPKIGTFVSGSAVVADETKVSEIVGQQRKLAGLDMEAFGLMQAGSLADSSIKTFSAKAVVDHAGESKGNKYHEAGCTISARFCVDAISKLLAE